MNPYRLHDTDTVSAAVRDLRRKAANCDAQASFDPDMHWSERLAWRLLADDYRARADMLSERYTAIEAERAALLARGATLA